MREKKEGRHRESLLQLSQVAELVWKIMEEDQRIMKGMREVPEVCDLSQEEWEALKGLRKNSSIVIKPADKGSMVVVIDRVQYVREAMRQLQDREFYQELERPIYPETIDIIKTELELLKKKRDS